VVKEIYAWGGIFQKNGNWEERGGVDLMVIEPNNQREKINQKRGRGREKVRKPSKQTGCH